MPLKHVPNGSRFLRRAVVEIGAGVVNACHFSTHITKKAHLTTKLRIQPFKNVFLQKVVHILRGSLSPLHIEGIFQIIGRKCVDESPTSKPKEAWKITGFVDRQTGRIQTKIVGESPQNAHFLKSFEYGKHQNIKKIQQTQT